MFSVVLLQKLRDSHLQESKKNVTNGIFLSFTVQSYKTTGDLISPPFRRLYLWSKVKPKEYHNKNLSIFSHCTARSIQANPTGLFVKKMYAEELRPYSPLFLFSPSISHLAAASASSSTTSRATSSRTSRAAATDRYWRSSRWRASRSCGGEKNSPLLLARAGNSTEILPLG